MILEFSDTKGLENRYIFTWKHLRDKNGIPYATECYIFEEVDGPELISIGPAMCHPKDNFSKFMGRKLSLERALKGFNKDFRKKSWEVFLKENKKYISKHK